MTAMTPCPPVARRASEEIVLSNAQIVCRDESFLGCVTVVDGVIADIAKGRWNAPGAVDMEGAFLLPGLVDVHTDNLEKHTIPRPGVFWNPVTAAVAHDAVIVAAGITTVFDSLCVGAIGKPDRRIALPRMIEGLQAAEQQALLRAEHVLHLRCDLAEATLIDDVEAYLDHPALRFVSILEDSPRRDPAHFASVAEKRKLGAESGAVPACEDLLRIRRRISAECQRRGIPWGNHDDTKAWHIDEGVALGMAVAEFPLTMEAVDAAEKAGVPVIGGAPNLVAGKSHSGNISMRDLAVRRRLGMLCSDYIPASLLHAVAILVADPIGLSLPEAVRLVSTAPAEAFGMTDRGVIEVGRRADLIQVAFNGDGPPVLQSSWCNGRRIY